MGNKNWQYAAGLVWPIITAAAKRSAKLTYNDIAPYIPTNPLSVRHALSPIQDYCLENRLPPLTAIVIGKTSKKPGTGFIAWDIDDINAAYKAVFEYNWENESNPYGGFESKDTVESLGKQLIRNVDSNSDVYSKVRVRGIAQLVFREALLRAYQYQCAICKFSFAYALEAAHIIPWQMADSSQRLDPRNGLLLCASHHKMFDAGLITVSRSYKVIYDLGMKDGPYSEADKLLTIALHGKPIHLPTDERHWPNPDWLGSRHEWIKLPKRRVNKGHSRD